MRKGQWPSMAAFIESLGRYSLQQMILACRNKLGDDMEIVILGYTSPHSSAEQMKFDSEATPLLLNSLHPLFQPAFPPSLFRNPSQSGPTAPAKDITSGQKEL